MNLFKKLIDPIMAKLQVIEKSDTAIIEEIHAAFDGAEEYLLQEAKRILSLPSAKYGDMKLLDRAERLEKIGFIQSEDVRNATGIRQAIADVKERKQMSEKIASTIEYYRTAYQFLKFLTEDEMERICEKYGLIFAPVSAYRGQVPDKNIIDIEKAQTLKACDDATNLFFFEITKFWDDATAEFRAFFKKKIQTSILITGERDLKLYLKGKISDQSLEAGRWLFKDGAGTTVKRQGLFICAPPTDFNLDGLDKLKKGFFQTEIQTVNDPIVFRYCRGGIQVLTKWGLEASDPSLTNHADN